MVRRWHPAVRRPLTASERKLARRWYERGEGSAGDNAVLFLTAPKGAGKSTLAKAIIKEHPRVVIFDAHGEYGDAPSEKCETAWEMEESIALMLEKARLPLDKPFCIALRVTDDEEALKLFGMVWEMPNILLVVEESSRFCKPSLLPREVARVLRFGRHRNISQLYIAQRPSAVHPDVRANADLIIAFRQHEPRDIAYLRAVAGPRAERLSSIPDYKVMVFGDLRRAPLAVIERMVEHPQGELDLKPKSD